MLRDDYAYEIKWDGYRMIAVNDGKRTTLYSRPGRVITADWPEIAAAIPDNVILDGEIIMVRDGKSSFQALQNAKRMRPAARAEGLRYVAFDLLSCHDEDFTRRPLEERRMWLADSLTDNPLVTFSHAIDDGRDAWKQVLKYGLEGIIAKPLSSRYVQGNRGIWLKHKRNVVQVFEVIGYTSGEGTRYGLFGALVLGERINGKLRYAGKCGTGFDRPTTVATLEAMKAHVAKAPPVDPGQAVVVQQHLGARTITWLKPALKAKVEFNDWSDDRIVRMGSFKGMEA
jgi:bifunctional non-homologous end joining protein LigD